MFDSNYTEDQCGSLAIERHINRRRHKHLPWQHVHSTFLLAHASGTFTRVCLVSQSQGPVGPTSQTHPEHQTLDRRGVRERDEMRLRD